MKKTNGMNRTAVCAMCLAANMFLMASVSVAQVTGTIAKKGGGMLIGTIRWLAMSKEYVVTAENGQEGRVPLRAVESVEVKEPEEWEGILKQLQDGRYAEAMPMLEKIMDAYTMLQWDVHAAKRLAEAHMAMKAAPKAVAVCEKVVGDNPAAGLSGELAFIYWDALLEAEKYSVLRKTLDDAIKSGGQETLARAYIKRGDMDKKKGNIKEALLDGYLRAIVFFEKVAEVQPEALYKAVKCFEQLGQHSNAEKMRQKLRSEHPRSSYTQKIASGA